VSGAFAKFLVALTACFIGLPVSTMAQPSEKAPPCYGTERWATQTALVAMVNAGMIKDFASIYRDQQPYHLKTTLLESRPIGTVAITGYPPVTVHRQIQRMEVATKDGQHFEVLTISEATKLECSMSGVTVIILSPEYKVLNTGTSTPMLPPGQPKP
jgi:hypothetical protein